MNWEATDQFGNLYVGTSEADSIEALRQDIESMVEEVYQRCETIPTFSVDVAYNEISAPDGNQVSHVLTVPYMTHLALTESIEIAGQRVQELIQDVLSSGGREGHVQGPWD